MGCGCNDAVLTVPCTQSTNCTENCNCPLKLGSVCVLYDGEPLLTLNVIEGEDLTSILKKINDLLNTALNPDNLYINIGGGAESFKQVNTLSQAEFRTLVSGDASISIVQGANTIDIRTAVAEITATNVGTGEGIFKDKVGNTINLKSFVSDTIDITTEGADEIRIEFSQLTDLPRYIVNNLYTGSEELGTAAKPFKTIAAAVAEYVGVGTPDTPENEGATIIIQQGNTYTFTGNFSYKNLKVVVEENTVINHSPSTGGYLIDLDSLAIDAATTNTLEIKSGAEINMSQRGFRNRGSSGGVNAVKEILISGTGRINLTGARQAGYAMIDCNSGNSSGYAMPSFQNIEVSDTFLYCSAKDVWNIGRDADVFFTNCTIRHSDTATSIDVASESFDQTGGTVTLSKCDLFINGAAPGRTNGFTLTKDPSYGCTLIMDRCKLWYPVNAITNLFVNQSTATNYPMLQVRYFTMTNSNSITNLIDSPFLWNQNLYFEYNTFFSGVLDDTKVDLTDNNTRSVSNIIKGQVVQSLQSFPDRTTAAGSLQTGGMFINTNSANPDTGTHFIDIVI